MPIYPREAETRRDFHSVSLMKGYRTNIIRRMNSKAHRTIARPISLLMIINIYLANPGPLLDP